VLAALARRPDARRIAADGLRRSVLASLARSAGIRATADEVAAAERAWLSNLGVPGARRDAFLAASGLDDGEARRIAEDLALQAALLERAERVIPDGPSWEEGLALGARLGGTWAVAAAGIPRRRAARSPAAPRRGRRG
jgi:hypothetical protein